MPKEQGMQKAESRVETQKAEETERGAEGTQAPSVCAAGKDFQSSWESIWATYCIRVKIWDIFY